MEGRCSNEHRIFVAEVLAIESDGKVCVITVCTNCGEISFKEHQVTKPGVQIRLLQEEKLKGK